jgi:hypothetical protein
MSITRKNWRDSYWFMPIRVLVIVILLALAFIPILSIHVLGYDTSKSCSGSVLSESLLVEGITLYFNTTCDYGCDSNSKACNPHPIVQNSVFFLVVIGILGLFYILSKK